MTMLYKIRELMRSHRLFFPILIFSGLVFSPFLGEHWVHDSYLIARYGYGYMIPRLLNQGRVISSLFLRGLNAVSMPYIPAMAFSVSLSLVFLSLASYTVFLMAKEQGLSGKMASVLALIGSAGIFFNLFVVETLMFYENAVMSFGALCAALAARSTLRGKYVPAVIFAVICVFCYQAVIAYYLPLVLLFKARRRKVRQVSCSIANYLMASPNKIIAFAIYALALASNYIFVRMVSMDARVTGTISYRSNIRGCYEAVIRFLRTTLGLTPTFLFTAFIVAFAVIILFNAFKSRTAWTVVRTVLAGGALVGCAMVPHVMMSYFYVMPRSAVGMAGLGGLLIVAMSSTRGALLDGENAHGPNPGDAGLANGHDFSSESDAKDPARKKGSIGIVPRIVSLALASIFTLTIAWFQLDMQVSSIRNNKLDAAEIAVAADIIRRYEEESGIVVTHIYVLRDSRTIFRRDDFRNYGDLTIRALSVSWMIAPHLSDALGRELQGLPTPEGAYERLVAGHEWYEFSPEQLMFEDAFLYFCIY